MFHHVVAVASLPHGITVPTAAVFVLTHLMAVATTLLCLVFLIVFDIFLYRDNCLHAYICGFSLCLYPAHAGKQKGDCYRMNEYFFHGVSVGFSARS